MPRGFRTHRRQRRNATGQNQGQVTVASASLVTKKQITRTTARQDWQEETWGFLDRIGEARFAATWRSNATSRAHLHIATPDPEGGGDPSPAEDPPELVSQLLEELHQGQIGQTEMLRRIALHLTCVGETYLVGIDADPEYGSSAARRWLVASNAEFSNRGGKPRVQLPDTGENLDLDPERSTIIRLWTPHARIAWHADSAMRAALGSLREIDALTKHINATLESRLAGPGILAIPNEASMPTPAQSDGTGVEPVEQDSIREALQEAMVTAIQDPNSVSALAPILIQIPKESIDGIKHIPLDHELSDKVVSMRQDAIRRFAGAMDMPGEIILGMSGGGSGESVNHWSAWQISEEAVSMHIEPLLGCICDALTQQYLWPALRAAGEPDPEQWMIWYDSSELTQRPDRSAEAQALYDKGALGQEALLRENGFSEEDAPSDDERTRLLARDLLLAKPELIQTELAGLVGLPQVQPPEPTPPSAVASERADQSNGGNDQQRALENTSRNEPPQESTTASARSGKEWMLAAAEQATLRALELAGKRLFTKEARSNRAANGVRGERGSFGYEGLPAWELHTEAPATDYTSAQLDKLLAGAHETLQATITDPRATHALDVYWRALLTTGSAHSREQLLMVLSEAGCFDDRKESA